MPSAMAIFTYFDLTTGVFRMTLYFTISAVDYEWYSGGYSTSVYAVFVLVFGLSEPDLSVLFDAELAVEVLQMRLAGKAGGVWLRLKWLWWGYLRTNSLVNFVWFGYANYSFESRPCVRSWAGLQRILNGKFFWAKYALRFEVQAREFLPPRWYSPRCLLQWLVGPQSRGFLFRFRELSAGLGRRSNRTPVCLPDMCCDRCLDTLALSIWLAVCWLSICHRPSNTLAVRSQTTREGEQYERVVLIST